MKPTLLIILYRLAEIGAYPSEVQTTTSQIAAKLGCSQQTVSRHLIELGKLGLVRRSRANRGEIVGITEEGAKELRLMHATLQRVLEVPQREIVIEGEVFSGFGEGAYYVSQPGYRKQFIEKLGFDPYPGTLNLKVTKQHQKARAMLEVSPAIIVEGFSSKFRSFGRVNCFKAIVNEKASAAVITAMRSHYANDVLEVIASSNLRKALNLKDGDIAKVRITTSTPRSPSS